MDNLWCILIPILAAIIGAILGWLLRHLTCNCDDDKKEIERLKAKINKLEADLKACLARKPERIEVPVNKLNVTPPVATEPKLNFDANAAKLAFGKKVFEDDLKVVEGIGPKIEQLFKDKGIKTWYQLSKEDPVRLKEILISGGKRYEIHNPTTWPKQGEMAFKGQWAELKALQDRLDGGVDRG